jgi:hypothetical protein
MFTSISRETAGHYLKPNHIRSPNSGSLIDYLDVPTEPVFLALEARQRTQQRRRGTIRQQQREIQSSPT